MALAYGLSKEINKRRGKRARMDFSMVRGRHNYYKNHTEPKLLPTPTKTARRDQARRGLPFL